ncbi:helix-turn-helix domain-containing protein [Desertivirga brevis]|uniref:helix-turn-helix domain-containing protein n=1 Tax=Desertivirga brevis TaxID=2810310 RepID=UPI001A962217|nr:AraC family transcriptional regulator [Pedobacter sp. SYSU D00873]
MELYIKNMVCRRCVLTVDQVLSELDLHSLSTELGIVKLKEQELTMDKQEQLSKKLEGLGFELLEPGKSRLIERIKNIIISKVHHSETLDLKVNWSQIISSDLHHDYNYLSALFSSVEGITIEQFIIRQRIEKAKELILYKELNLSEIAFKLGYSSVQYLSTQFKQVTGQTPSQFKSSVTANLQRKPLDSVGD